MVQSDKKVASTATRRRGGKEKSDKDEVSKDEDRLRIRIKAYDARLIDEAAKKIVEAGIRADVKVVGPIPLPTRKKKVTVNRKTQQRGNSSFEAFEMRIHKRLIDVLSPNDKIIESLSALNLPSGVEVEMAT